MLVISLFALRVSAAIRFVDANSTNAIAPYLSWATAASNIQAAVDFAQTADTILVTNGVYNNGGRSFSGSQDRVAIDSKVLTIASVNGPSVTVIQGFKVPNTGTGQTAVRGVYLTSGSVLSGFTVTNCATTTNEFGGAVKCQSLSAVITNCILTQSTAGAGGGGAYSGTLINCFVNGNTTTSDTSSGAGAFTSTLINCIVSENASRSVGGGAASCTLINCTVVSNTAVSSVNGVNGGTVENSIVYYNSPDDIAGAANVTNCCTPFATFGSVNVITNAPLFANAAASDFHLQVTSPCINAGNNSFITNSLDLDGKPRIVAGTVDLGAYEFSSPIHFVALNSSTPVSPYTNWATAASNIQDAIDASVAGDLVLVSNGTYNAGARIEYGASSNRVVINKAITVESVNGPTSTIIAGSRSPAAPPLIRCVYMTNGTLLSGFTLTNGSSRTAGDATNEQSGGAVWCESTSATISNCVLVGSYANQLGGGSFRGTLNNCSLSNNAAFIGGGGAYASVLNNCIVNSNRLIQGFGGGGVAFSTISGSILTRNTAPSGGGAYFSTLTGCSVSSNSATFGGGAYGGSANITVFALNNASQAGGGVYSNALNNCIVFTNRCTFGAGGVYGSTLNNCTVLANTTGADAGGIQACTANNCILFFNFGFNGTDSNYLTSTLNYCDTQPLASGPGNITNFPVFISYASDNFHQQSNSPAINSGNNTFVTTATDLDGNPRIAGGTVDMGAFEFQTPTSLISYAWLQQFGLPTDGSADFIDSDGDGLNNWAEWRAGTNPTNALSVLEANAPAVGASGVTITWQSETNVTYYVQRTPDLNTPFSSIQSNIVGQAGTTSYTDTNASSGSFYYRVGVQ